MIAILFEEKVVIHSTPKKDLFSDMISMTIMKYLLVDKRCHCEKIELERAVECVIALLVPLFFVGVVNQFCIFNDTAKRNISMVN